MTAIVRVDRGGIIVHWNAAAEQLFGYTAGEAIGHPLEMIIPEPSHAGHRQGFARFVATGVKTLPEILTAVGRHKNGQPVKFQISTTAVLDDKGAVAAVEGAMRAG